MRVALFSLIPETRFGGSAVYAAHLYRAFKECGHEPSLYRVGKKSERFPREFTHEVPYRNCSIEDAEAIAKSTPSLITYSHWKTHSKECLQLLATKVPIVVHDPAEFHPEMLESIRKNKSRVVGIRRINTERLRGMGADAIFIAHPYVRFATTRAPTVHAYCLGRVDFRKHHEIVCEANTLLDVSKQIQIQGSLNRIFAFHKLDKDFPGWRKNFHGTFPTTWGSGVSLLARARFAVDLSVIKSGDGDGSQYLFMEAWDAGTPLIVHREWIRTGKDEVRDGETARAIGSPQELAAALSTEWDTATVVEGGREQLKAHDSSTVIPQYLETIHGV